MKLLSIFPCLRVLDSFLIDFELAVTSEVFRGFYLELSKTIVPFLTIIDQDINILRNLANLIGQSPAILRETKFSKLL